MCIIFRAPINKNQPLPSSFAIFLLFLTIVNSQQCQPFHFDTQFTRCQITLDQCSTFGSTNQGSASPIYYKFKSCTMQKCVTLGAGPDCHSFVTMQLQEKECFHSCCQSKTFVPQECDANNISLQSSTEKINGYIAIVLSVCTLGLVVAIFIFIVCYLKCFESKQVKKEEPQVPVWKKMPYKDQKCKICDQYGSVIQTACGHYFHFSCYQKCIKDQLLQGYCPICQKISNRFRLWCNDCHEKCLKVGFDELDTVQQMQKYYQQCKILHLDCLKDINQYIKTDVRLTSSTQ